MSQDFEIKREQMLRKNMCNYYTGWHFLTVTILGKRQMFLGFFYSDSENQIFFTK